MDLLMADIHLVVNVPTTCNRTGCNLGDLALIPFEAKRILSVLTTNKASTLAAVRLAGN